MKLYGQGACAFKTNTTGWIEDMALIDDDAGRAKRAERMVHGLTNHTPDESQVARIGDIRLYGKALGECIIYTTNPSRDQSLALTALEDCVMRAIRAIVLEDVE